MPPVPNPPPVPAAVNQTLLLEETQQLLEVSPRLAFTKASLLRDSLLRERMRRDAFIEMSRRQPTEAATVLAEVIDARWLPSVHFAQALDIAWFTVREQPELTKRFLLASARRHPAVALREVRQYLDLPYGREIRSAAQEATPGEEPELMLLRLRENGAISLPPSQAAYLAARARTEEERETAVALLRRVSWESEDVSRPSSADLRGALALLAESGSLSGVPAQVLRRALTGFEDEEDPLSEAVKIATFLAEAPAGVADGLPPSKLGRLLREPLGGEGATLRVAEMFPNGLCLQRYVFYNDDDGVESFDSFVRSYTGDGNWSVERTSDHVHVISKSAGARRIEIYANVPVDLQLPENYAIADAVRARQGLVTRILRERKLEPVMLVHRGHDHHFDSTQRLLRSEARLVFLGSCRGMANVEAVVTRCRRAQMIATRGVGATGVNDAFLRALNRKLAAGGEQLKWDEFWAELASVLGSNGQFSGYVPPYRNAAALFLTAWYREALSAQ